MQDGWDLCHADKLGCIVCFLKDNLELPASYTVCEGQAVAYVMQDGCTAGGEALREAP